MTPVLIDKLLAVRDDLVAVFVDPIATQGLVTAALGFVMIVAGVFWARRPAALAVLPTPSVPFETEQARPAGRVVDDVREEPAADAPDASDQPEVGEPVAEPPSDEPDEPEDDAPPKPASGA